MHNISVTALKQVANKYKPATGGKVSTTKAENMKTSYSRAKSPELNDIARWTRANFIEVSCHDKRK